MLQQLTENLEFIKKLNKADFLIKKIDQSVIKEQEENLDDLKDLLERYSKVIEKLENNGFSNTENSVLLMINIHGWLCDLGWHVRQIDETLQAFVKSLPQLNSNKIIASVRFQKSTGGNSMLQQLNKTLELIAKFNKDEFLKRTIDPHLFKEQQENLEKLKDLLERYSENMKMLKTKDQIGKTDLMLLSDVHKIHQELSQRIDSLDDLVGIFLKSLSPLEEE